MKAKAVRERDGALEFAERAGVVWGELGMPRMAGRVLGWLLVCDPAHQSLTELADVLQASKASISTSTRMLVQIGLLERVSFPGDRRDYVRIKPDAWGQMLNRFDREVKLVLGLADEGLAILGDAPPDRRQRLLDLRALYAFMLRQAPAFLEAWQRERQAAREKP